MGRPKSTAFVPGRSCDYADCGEPLVPRPGETPSMFAKRRFCRRRCSARHNRGGCPEEGVADPGDEELGAVGDRYREVHEAKLDAMPWQWRRFKRRVYKAPRFDAKGA